MTQNMEEIVDEVVDLLNGHGLDFNDGMNVLARCVARGLFIMNGTSQQNDAFFAEFKEATLNYKASLKVNNVSIHNVAGHA